MIGKYEYDSRKVFSKILQIMQKKYECGFSIQFFQIKAANNHSRITAFRAFLDAFLSESRESRQHKAIKQRGLASGLSRIDKANCRISP